MSKRRHTIVKIKIFLLFVLVDGRIRIRICSNDESGSRRVKNIPYGSYESGSGSTTLILTVAICV
jgi:hypothetical protein